MMDVIEDHEYFTATLSPTGMCKIIARETDLVFFQYPVITERFCKEKDTKNDEIFLHIPWATLIDRKKFAWPNDFFTALADSVNRIKKKLPNHKVATCCQHISVAKLTNYFEQLSVEILYASHLHEFQPNVAFALQGMPLYPVNAWDKTRCKDLQCIEFQKRRLLCSFVGSVKSNDLDSSRQKLLQFETREDLCLFHNTGQWHFENIVYERNTQKRQLRLPNESLLKSKVDSASFYNRVLSDTKFCFCPIGSGPNTIRLWECMCIGCVPVVFTDHFNMRDYLPNNVDPKNFCIEISLNDPCMEEIGQLIHFLKSFDQDAAQQISQNCIDLMKKFSETGWLCSL